MTFGSGSLGTAVLDLDVNASGLTTGMDKAESKTKSGMANTAAGVGIGLAAFEGLKFAVGNAWDELSNSQKVGAQTDAVLKSTGSVANVTSGHVSDLANSIMNYSGLDDEAVQSGENMLLTFTKVQNGVGAGNQIFDRATKAVVDLSVGMGKDMTSSAILVGKALNDPVKGATALSRAGVQLTQSQRDAIKAMVDTGNTAGAQKIILKELETQFGGSAAAAGNTLPGQLSKARNAFDNLSAAMLAKVLPVFLGFANMLNATFGFLQRYGSVFGPILAGLGAMVGLVLLVAGALRTYAIAQAIANAAMLANPIVLIITLLVGLVAAITVAWKESETFRNVVLGVWAAVKAGVSAAVNFIQGLLTALRNAFLAVLNWLRANWPAIAMIISGPFAPLVALATNAFGIRSALVAAFSDILSTVRSTMNTIVSIIRGLWDDARQAGQTLGQNIWNGISQGIQKVAQLAGELSSKVSSAVSGVAASAAGWAFNIGQGIVNGIINGLGGLFSAVKSKVESSLKGALDAVNPFSPVEHGGEMYIGRPLVEGAVAGLDGLDHELTSRLNSNITTGVSDVNIPALSGRISKPSSSVNITFSGPVIGAGDTRSLGRELARIVQPALDRRVSLSA